MPRASAPRKPRAWGLPGVGGGAAGGGGPGGLPAGRGGPAAQSSPFSTSAQPLGSFPPGLRVPSSFQSLNGSAKPEERKTRGGRGGGWRMDGVEGRAFWQGGRAAGGTCQGQAVLGRLPQGSRAWPAAPRLRSVSHCSGVPSGWAAATSPGFHPQSRQGGGKKPRNVKHALRQAIRTPRRCCLSSGMSWRQENS